MLDEKGYELAPCIVSKAKHALKLPNRYTKNIKTCSTEYWCRVIDLLASEYNITDIKRINRAKKSTHYYLKK